MYRFNFILLFNKFISLLLIFSLSVLSFSFSADENIKQEIGVLYSATSISNYYNSITKISYNLINKILESANVVVNVTSSQKEKNKKEQKNKNNKNLDLLKLNAEKEIKLSDTYHSSFYTVLFDAHIFSYQTVSGSVRNLFVYGLFYIKTSFCYFARGNIDNIININNIMEGNRLV